MPHLRRALCAEGGAPAAGPVYTPVSLNLMRYSTQFLLSAMAAEQFPAPDVPEIAFLGRSNVGKSSLLNTLTGDKTAKVSSTPGRTRAINFFALLDQSQRRRFVFADLPGYGYAKISKSISAGWPAFIEPYLAIRSTLKLCICLVDSNVPVQESDRQLIDWLRGAGREFAVAATKIDRLSGNERSRNLQALKTGLEIDEVLAVSAKTGYGVKDLWARIEASGGQQN
ncbi:MAG: ribosome biogenesis GTP-binding protein YihA/YsxC [Terracidiphilus sp.]